MTLVLLTVYVLILAVVIHKAWMRNRTDKDYIIAKKSLGAVEVAASATAGVLDVTGVFVLFGSILFFGLAGIGLWIAYLGATVLMAILSPYFYETVSREDVWTFSDFFKVRFGSKTEKLFGLASSLFIVGIIVGLYSINLMLFERFFSIGPVLSTILSFAITITYVLIGGFKALVRTDILQYAIMLMFLLAAVVLFPETETVTRSAELSEWFGGVFLMFAPVIFFQNMLKPAAWQPIIGAKSKQSAQRGMWLAVLLNTLIVAPIVWISFAYAQVFPESVPTEVLLDALGVALPAYLTPLIFVGLLAALMSSLDTALFFVASNVTRNLLPSSLKKRFGEMKLVRIGVVVITLATVLMAVLVPDFITFVLNITPLMGIIAIPFFVGLFVSCTKYDTQTAVAYGAGIASFAYIFANTPENYLWNLAPIVTTGVIFLIALMLGKNQPQKVAQVN